MSKQFDLSVLFRVIDKATGPIRKVGQSLNNLTNPVHKANRAFKELGVSVGKTSEKMRSMGATMSLKMTAPLMLIGGLATRSAIKFESAFTGVRKTVDATEEQFAALKKELMALALEIPVATTGLFGIAETAGQLAIERENIRDFVKVIADLGTAAPILEMSEAATQLAQFANITKMSQKDFEKLASTIVYLGNNTATTENKILDMTMRLAGAGNLVGMTQSEIVGMAASLAQLGIEAEMGGSAFSQVMMRINKEIGSNSKKMKGFAKVANQPVKEFEKLWKENASEAVLKFVEGLGRLSKEGKNVNKILDVLGMDGIRIADALLRSSGAGDKFRETIRKGNTAWKENVALVEEANKRYATTESQLIMTKNRLEQTTVAYGDILKKALLGISNGFKPVLDFFKNLSPEVKTVMLILGGLAAVIGPILLAIGTLGGVFAAIVASPVAGAFIAIAGAIAILTGAVVGLVKIFSNPVQKIFDKLSNMAIFGMSKLGIGPDEATIRKNMAAAKTRADIASGAVQQGGSENISQTVINIKVTSDSGSTATIEKVKKKSGDANVSVASIGYVGAH